jgi:hypothetical protein
MGMGDGGGQLVLAKLREIQKLSERTNATSSNFHSKLL